VVYGRKYTLHLPEISRNVERKLLGTTFNLQKVVNENYIFAHLQKNRGDVWLSSFT